MSAIILYETNPPAGMLYMVICTKYDIKSYINVVQAQEILMKQAMFISAHVCWSAKCTVSDEHHRLVRDTAKREVVALCPSMSRSPLSILH